MKTTSLPKPTQIDSTELLPEYHFDYANGKPNRFPQKIPQGSLTVILDPDVASVFQDAESVNAVLRALPKTMPPAKTRRGS